MCMDTSDWNLIYPFNTSVRWRRQYRGRNFRVHRLHSRKSRSSKERARVGMLKAQMQINNLKLYMENKSIIEENEKLRKKAQLLHQENKALVSQLQKVYHPHNKFAHNNKQ